MWASAAPAIVGTSIPTPTRLQASGESGQALVRHGASGFLPRWSNDDIAIGSTCQWWCVCSRTVRELSVVSHSFRTCGLGAARLVGVPDRGSRPAARSG
jgi:hypothetical protein